MANQIFKSYSQYGEDYLIWKYFEEKKEGLIIEIGAFDGIYFSTSKALEDLGWKSICIEPNPEMYNKLVSNRPHSICSNYVLIDNESQKESIFHIEPLGLYSGIHPNKNLEKIYADKEYELKLNQIRLPASTLNKVLKNNNIIENQIDCITIDVEGNELSILKGFDLEYYQPKLLIIEANTEKDENSIITYLVNFNYHLTQKNKVNLIFTLHNLNKSTVNINKIQPQFLIHPKGIVYTEQSALYIEKNPNLNFGFKLIKRFIKFIKRK